MKIKTKIDKKASRLLLNQIKKLPTEFKHNLDNVGKTVEHNLEAVVPQKSGKAKSMIMHVVSGYKVSIGWSKSSDAENVAKYMAGLNFGAKRTGDGWIIPGANNKSAHTLLFPVAQSDKEYNLPIVNINGEDFYMAKSVKHPYQKPLKFLETTVQMSINEIETLLQECALRFTKV